MRYGFLGRAAIGGALVASASIGVLAGPVSAATRVAASTVTCKGLLAHYPADTGKLTGCDVATTGGSGKLTNFTPGGATINWKNGTTTTYASGSSPETDTTEHRKCASADQEVEITGAVASSTNTAIAQGAPVKMEVCVTSPTPAGGKLTNEPSTVITFG